MNQSISETKQHQKRNFSLIVLLGIIWGSAFAVAKYALTHGVPPLGYTFWQTFGPALLLWILTHKSFTYKTLKAYWHYFLLTALFGILIPNTNRYLITPLIPSSHLAIISNTVPLFIYPLAILSRTEKFNWQQLFGFILGIMGIFLMLSFEMSEFLHGKISAWFMMALLTPFCYALSSVYIVKKRPALIDSKVLAMNMLLFATLLLAPFTIMTHQFYIPKFNLASLTILIEILLSTIGYVLLFDLLKKVGAISYSLSDGIVVATSIFWGWLLFKEPIGLLLLIAVSLVLTGIHIQTSRHR